VAGVLVEKAKTTPNAYPLSLNAICTACNQKSNRAPVMSLEPEDVEEALERLRHQGAAGMVEGYGRVTKYRHYLYDWLGVDKVEIAVMAELLLRGAQTVGELRARAARMEPIRDLGQLRPILDSLKSKGLVVSLTPEGRGHVVTHALYPPDELERVKARYQAAGPAAAAPGADVARPIPTGSGPAPAGLQPGVAEALKRGLDELRSQVAQLRSDLDDLSAAVERNEDRLHRLRDELGG
jgi:uncharacterized protein YceH (UPF0502 family)